MNDKEYEKYISDMKNVKKWSDKEKSSDDKKSLDDKTFDRYMEIYSSIEPPTKLYRYRKFNAYTLDEIIKSRIYMSKFSQFNDNFETRSLFLKYILATRGEKVVSFYERMLEHEPQNEGDELILEEIRNRKEGIDKRVADMEDIFGVACFCEKNTNYAMWAHYADGNRGICIEYDVNNFDNAEGAYLMPTVYSDEFDKYYSNESNIKSNAFMISLFKHKDWSYEQEWRLVKLIDKLGPSEKERYTYNAKINAIYFGVDMPESDKKVIKQYVGNNNIKLYSMKIKHTGMEAKVYI